MAVNNKVLWGAVACLSCAEDKVAKCTRLWCGPQNGRHVARAYINSAAENIEIFLNQTKFWKFFVFLLFI